MPFSGGQDNSPPEKGAVWEASLASFSLGGDGGQHFDMAAPLSFSTDLIGTELPLINLHLDVLLLRLLGDCPVVEIEGACRERVPEID